MRDDLLHAQASVDWAESNLPSFRRKTSDWLKANIYLTIRKQPPNSPNDVLVAIEKATLPIEFQVEAGAYVNAIRSSLDILACSLASRHCQSLIDETYFPVAASEDAFVAGKYKGSKFVKALPTRERSIIESLKPYKGGNGLLYPLHLLDVVRKHQRLLKAEFQPAGIYIVGNPATRRAFTPVASGWMRSGPDETVVGLLAKGTPQPQVELTTQISLGETAYLPHREVVTALYEFANLAKAIIRNFDY